MKPSKKLLVMVAVFGMVAFLAVTAHAAQWYYCQVVQAGPGWGQSYIMLTHSPSSGSPLFVNKWFYPRSDLTNEMLATALTALANNQTVYIGTNSNLGTSSYGKLEAIYLQP